VTAVDPRPMDYTRYQAGGLYQYTGQRIDDEPQRPWFPTRRMTAGQYLQKHQGSPDATLLIVNPDDNDDAWIWTFDWTRKFEGESMVITFTTSARFQRFRNMLEREAWMFVKAITIPKWFAGATPDRTAPLELWRRKPRDNHSIIL
jgi:hypothetical protein